MSIPTHTTYGEPIPVDALEGYVCARDARRSLEAALALVVSAKRDASSFEENWGRFADEEFTTIAHTIEERIDALKTSEGAWASCWPGIDGKVTT
jgi:hypothetical protein